VTLCRYSKNDWEFSIVNVSVTGTCLSELWKGALFKAVSSGFISSFTRQPSRPDSGCTVFFVLAHHTQNSDKLGGEDASVTNTVCTAAPVGCFLGCCNMTDFQKMALELQYLPLV
jgi:hypothetical protein